MRVYCYCKRCKTEIVCSKDYSDRGEMSMDEGLKIDLSCSNCYQKSSYHPNELIAERRKSVFVAALVVFLISASVICFFTYRFYLDHYDYFQTESVVILFKKTGYVIVLPFVLFGLIMELEKKKVRLFNSFKIKS